ncbi:MAG TPA: PEP/pyruvate-binding domain-containing protein, partial [Vicinamibacterales bacterium]
MAKTVKTARKSLARVKSSSRKAPSKSARSAGAKRYVYFFGRGKADGDRRMRDVLGGKGAGLAEMTNAGLPVPPGFTMSTAVCTIYDAHNGRIPPTIDREMLANLRKLESTAKATFGSATN